jgi:hypothetical protein
MQKTGFLHVKHKCFLSTLFPCKKLIMNDTSEVTDNLMIG